MLTTWRVALKRLREILLYADLEFSELVTAIAALTWGLWLLAPWTFLDPARPVQGALARIASEEVWAAAALTLGLLQGIALARNITWLRLWVSSAAFFLWFSISVLFIAIDRANPHAPVYGILALAAGWAHLRVGVLRVHDPRLAAVKRCSDL